MTVREIITLLNVLLPLLAAAAEPSLRNDRYTLRAEPDGTVTVDASGIPPQQLVPEFTVLWSKSDPQCKREATHPNYMVAPRTAVRWGKSAESVEALNAWIGSPEFKAATGASGVVKADGPGRTWEFRDAQDKEKLRVTGPRAMDTTRPFSVGQHVVLRPVQTQIEADALHWEYEAHTEFTLAAELILPPGESDPQITYTLTPKQASFFSVAFTGAPDAPLGDTVAVPQESDARGHKQFDFVVSEADLHLPRAHVATASGNVALVVDPRECRFRLPTIADSRFGFMLCSESGRLKPVLFAPLLGGPESKMRAGEPWRFTFRCVERAGDWKDTYAHIARDIHGFHDQRDNSGPGSLNATLAHVVDFLADRHGGNHALWDAQQKYYDYFTDKTGVFKPFSPLYGLSVAIVTDDAEFFKTRALPAVEYALSRKTSVFAPYDTADNKQANSAGREVGAPYPGHEQLMSLHELFQRRSPVLRTLADSKPPHKMSTGASEEALFDLVDRASVTHDPKDILVAKEAAYADAAKISLYPAPPDTNVTVDRGGHAPVHYHSFGRHKNQWGYPPPQPVPAPEQTVPAWRIARVGLPGIAYPIEYWMNTYGAMMRTAALAHDDFLRDVARWGMVGRFGNFPGDNRSQDSLVQERPDAVDAPPWQWNFATVNAGHAWDFAGAVLDFLVSDAFERSRGAIDFPALSAAGSNFRVRIYGGGAGRFYGDENVHLWLPGDLLTSDNRQIDWLAAHGNGMLYLALVSQSFQEEQVNVNLNRALVECQDAAARCWRDNAPAAPLPIGGNKFRVAVPAKGIVAFAIPAQVKPRLQGKIYDRSIAALPPQSFTEVTAPFGKVHAMLLRAGKDLTSAYVYAEALPEHVIAAHLRWRQGHDAWQELTDDIYPYEFSPVLRDDGGNFECVFSLNDEKQKGQASPGIALALAGESPRSAVPAISDFEILGGMPTQPEPPQPKALPFSDDFISYLQRAASGGNFGLRADGRYYPYSTPQGRRIAWRQVVWDPTLYATGCTREQANEHLRAELVQTLAALKASLAKRQPSVDFTVLDLKQQEMLLDFANSEGIEHLSSALVEAVLGRDSTGMVDGHLYVRYAGHAPDHVRNKAFAERWIVSALSSTNKPTAK